MAVEVKTSGDHPASMEERIAKRSRPTRFPHLAKDRELPDGNDRQEGRDIPRRSPETRQGLRDECLRSWRNRSPIDADVVGVHLR